MPTDTVGVPLLEGRTFTTAYTPASPRVAVVSETMACRYWPDGTAVGRRFRLEGWDGVGVEVVGVSADCRVRFPTEESAPYLHFAASQRAWSDAVLLARTDGDAAALAVAIRRELRRREPDVFFYLQGDTLREKADVTMLPSPVSARTIQSPAAVRPSGSAIRSTASDTPDAVSAPNRNAACRRKSARSCASPCSMPCFTPSRSHCFGHSAHAFDQRHLQLLQRPHRRQLPAGRRQPLRQLPHPVEEHLVQPGLTQIAKPCLQRLHDAGQIRRRSNPLELHDRRHQIAAREISERFDRCRARRWRSVRGRSIRPSLGWSGGAG